ncbi:hypothetical protein PV328_003979 [Microctonus aethiopoides]|uniref:Uncharacterized protein n=1 Tax=Microctonus aethiopoides TaxID=144406 RepID=A0AA39F9K0_9HYME|nr:hypothetical protein PV328_003979 [Microctonus aethiopoides]
MLRQHQLHVRHGISAAKFDKPIFGVKGPSILSQMMPDVIGGCSIDVIHCVYSGVVKKLLEPWLDSNNRFKPFSLYHHKDIIDSRVMELKPPNFIKRPTWKNGRLCSRYTICWFADSHEGETSSNYV